MGGMKSKGGGKGKKTMGVHQLVKLYGTKAQQKLLAKLVERADKFQVAYDELESEADDAQAELDKAQEERDAAENWLFELREKQDAINDKDDTFDDMDDLRRSMWKAAKAAKAVRS